MKTNCQESKSITFFESTGPGGWIYTHFVFPLDPYFYLQVCLMIVKSKNDTGNNHTSLLNFGFYGFYNTKTANNCI